MPGILLNGFSDTDSAPPLLRAAAVGYKTPMQFRISDTFAKALCRLDSQGRTAAKIAVFDLQQNPSAPGLQFHRVERSRDRNFWSVRVNRDVRIIIHKTEGDFLICYAGHHDDAYKWAENRRIDIHPKTGAAQIVELRERVEEVPLSARPPEARPAEAVPGSAPESAPAPLLFDGLSAENLLSIGVPEDWAADVRGASEDAFFDIAEHLPAEAAEALLHYATAGALPEPATASEAGPFDHPDARRRFRVMENVAELERALEYPWDQWALFLHPTQRALVSKAFSGPARVAGSAGTGKTVVALHRAAHILRTRPDAKLLLTTFSAPLSNMLRRKLALLTDDGPHLDERVSVLPFEGAAREMFALSEGYDAVIARPKHAAEALRQAAAERGLEEFSERFLASEWRTVVDAWQVDGPEAYARVPRLGRKNRLGAKQRERLWPVFERTRQILAAQLRMTPAAVFGAVAAHYAARDDKPFTHIIVDEAQDLSVAALRMIGALAPTGGDGLFFAGDLGQRIFQQPFSWLHLGVDVRGRSETLKVNYRTSHQIRRAADRLLPDVVRDVDGLEEDRRGTVSVFNGPEPEVRVHASAEEEIQAVGLALCEAVDEGTPAEEIGVFVRSSAELARARAAVKESGRTALELSGRVEDRTGRIAVGVMHLAKGLEFRHVIIMACDSSVLPDQDRINTVADEAELDEVYETERHLFYVACTRAREKLIVSGAAPASEFFADLKTGAVPGPESGPGNSG